MAFTLVMGFLLPQHSWSPHGRVQGVVYKSNSEFLGQLILAVFSILDWSWLNFRSCCKLSVRETGAADCGQEES